MQTLTNQSTIAQRELKVASIPLRNFLPPVLLLVVACTTLFVGAVLPLRGLYLYNALPVTQLGFWLLLPTRLLFPGKAIIWPVHYVHVIPAALSVAWKETALLLASLTVLFGLYLLAVRILPDYITQRYILLSTALLGLVCMLFPAATSQDIFSYIAYARMGVIYHLNPLTTLPLAIHTDAVYPYIFWIHQPSAYGPTWAIITCALQWLAFTFGFKNLVAIILLLRLLGLVMHLCSIQLVWWLAGSLQRLTGTVSRRRQLMATLAFAWNPLLLLEACVNAHNDTTILFLILLAVYFLLPRTGRRPQSYLLAAVFLALAACLKITLVVLAPLLLLFLWQQQPRRIQSVIGALVAYLGTVVLLYAIFWQHGAILHVFQVNPGTTRDINGPYEFLTHLYESIQRKRFPYISSDTGVPIEVLTHKAGLVIFSVIYGIFCLYSLFVRQLFSSLLSLIRWMAVAWLFYCLVGSPWFWPWYLTTFFGLFALIEATGSYWHPLSKLLHLPLAVRLLLFAALSLYCFSTWGPNATFVPRLPYFQWTYMRGLWLCLLPLLAMWLPSLLPAHSRLRRFMAFDFHEPGGRPA